MSEPHRPGRRVGLLRVAGLVPALLVAVSLGACGAGPGPTVPALQTGDPHASPSGQVSEEQAMLAYAACMRQQGIDMPDPIVRADGRVEMQYPDNVDKRAFAVGDEACRYLLAQAYPAETPNPNQAAEQEALLAYARCMREHGIDMADPAPDGGPGSVTVPAYVEPNVAADPLFQAADDACKHLLPGKPGSSSSPAATPGSSGAGQ